MIHVRDANVTMFFFLAGNNSRPWEVLVFTEIRNSRTQNVVIFSIFLVTTPQSNPPTCQTKVQQNTIIYTKVQQNYNHYRQKLCEILHYLFVWTCPRSNDYGTQSWTRILQRYICHIKMKFSIQQHFSGHRHLIFKSITIALTNVLSAHHTLRKTVF